jgi:hypothetical protein
MVLLFSDVFFVRRSFPERFRAVQRTPWGVLALCGVVGVISDAAAVVLLFFSPWATSFTRTGWDLAVGTVTAVSIAVGLAIFLISERGRGARLRRVESVAESGLS